jgi:hypothetical protein
MRADFFEEMDNFAETGRFFVALTERLRDRRVTETDASRLAHTLRLPLPRALKDVSIEMVEDTDQIARATDHTTVVITYPPVRVPAEEAKALKVKKCFKFCKPIAGGKICAEVCVDIDVSFGGVHGNITANVSVSF